MKYWLLFRLFVPFIATSFCNESCNEDKTPDLDGAWVCSPDWIIETDMYEGPVEGTKTWVMYYFMPTFYAVSKIRALPTCDVDGIVILLLSAAVWDEQVSTNDLHGNITSTSGTEINWIEFDIPDMNFLDDRSQVYSGFARRSPYWRIQLDIADSVNRSCLPKLMFFAKAGIAASQHLLLSMQMHSSNQIKDPNDWMHENPPLSDTCKTVTQIPSNVVRKYRLDMSFYSKYTSAYGIPILSSRVVNERALQRACYVVRFMLADRADIRNHMFNNKGRVAIIGRRETVPMVPEMSIFPTFNRRAAGGTFQIPVNVGAEENMLCEVGDGYARNQDIFMHEFAHGIHLIACHTALPSFNRNLQQAFVSARRKGLWRNTYANTNNQEYFAEGVQAFFNQQREGPVGGDGIQNHIDTREELSKYDPTLYNIIKDLFPCLNDYIPRCTDVRQTLGLAQNLTMNCKGGGVITTTPTGTCFDENGRCASWARSGECTKNPNYMLVNCKRSCNRCPTSPQTTTTTSTDKITTELTPPTPASTTTSAAKSTSMSSSTTMASTTTSAAKSTPMSSSTTVASTATSQSTSTITTSRSTRTTTTAKPPSCEDDNQSCSYWAKNNECQINPRYMLVWCKRSCGRCVRSKCENNDRNCDSWAWYCWRNQYVKNNCKKTCRICY